MNAPQPFNWSSTDGRVYYFNDLTGPYLAAIFIFTAFLIWETTSSIYQVFYLAWNYFIRSIFAF